MMDDHSTFDRSQEILKKETKRLGFFKKLLTLFNKQNGNLYVIKVKAFKTGLGY
jgi:hypothetical protein